MPSGRALTHCAQASSSGSAPPLPSCKCECWAWARFYSTISCSKWPIGNMPSRDLLFYLVTTGERTREQIVADFWPDVDAAARNRLNVTVHFLRKALGARRWIVFENNRYRFDPVGPYSSDIDDFYSATALAGRLATSQPEQAIASLGYAISLMRGPFLADAPDGNWHYRLRAQFIVTTRSLCCNWLICKLITPWPRRQFTR